MALAKAMHCRLSSLLLLQTSYSPTHNQATVFAFRTTRTGVIGFHVAVKVFVSIGSSKDRANGRAIRSGQSSKLKCQFSMLMNLSLESRIHSIPIRAAAASANSSHNPTSHLCGCVFFLLNIMGLESIPHFHYRVARLHLYSKF